MENDPDPFIPYQLVVGEKELTYYMEDANGELVESAGGACEAVRPRRVRPSTIGGGSRTTYRLDRRQFVGPLTNASSVGLPGDRTQAQTVEKGLKVEGR